jgi:hypothetical protein
MEIKENMIEWINGQKHISVTLHDQKYIGKVKKLAEQYPNDVKIKAINEDGSIFAHIPRSALKLSIVKRNLTDEQRQLMGDRLRSLRKQ